MNQKTRDLFPILETTNYLNCAAVAPLPIPTIGAVIRQLEDVSRHGSSNYTEWIDTKTRARELIASMVNAKAENIAFLRNTSDGFASIAGGLDWSSEDNIVSFSKEFPANYYPWKRVRDKFGVELRLADEIDGRVDIDQLVSMIDSKTKLVAISAVQFASGFRADLERIGKVVRQHDALFAVDIIQALGTTTFDFEAQYVDLACSASHKWLCAPEGCGILFVSDRAREMVEPALVGWISVGTPWDFEDREQPYQPNALAWESGTGPSSLFYGLETSLRLLIDTGIGRIESHLEHLTDMLCESVDGNTFEIVSSRNPGEKSQIVTLEPKGDKTSDDWFHKLENENTVVSSRNGRLRIAPHLFNNENDIEKLVNQLR